MVSAGADVDAAKGWGYTPLHAAISRGHVNCVRLLLQAGADMNSVTARGSSCLYLASKYGHIGCARALMEAGAIVNAAADGYWMPLHAAC